MADQQPEQWHLSKAIPLSVILYLTALTVTGIWWSAKMDSRVSVLENKDPEQNARIQKLEDFGSKIAVMEERQVMVLKRMDIQTTTMQEILMIVGKLPKASP